MHKYFWSMYYKACCKYMLFNGNMIINYSYTLKVLNVWSINTNTGINIYKYKYRHQNIKFNKLVFDTLFMQVIQEIVHAKFFNIDLHVTTLRSNCTSKRNVA